MGYDIYCAGGSIEAPAGTFERIRRQGYDWFGLLGASNADGGGSGTGETLDISKKKLQDALASLRTHAPGPPDTGPTALDRMIAARHGGPNIRFSYGGPQDPFEHWKPVLDEFMVGCIAWCDEHDAKAIEITFA